MRVASRAHCAAEVLKALERTLASIVRLRGGRRSAWTAARLVTQAAGSVNGKSPHVGNPGPLWKRGVNGNGMRRRMDTNMGAPTD